MDTSDKIFGGGTNILYSNAESFMPLGVKKGLLFDIFIPLDREKIILNYF